MFFFSIRVLLSFMKISNPRCFWQGSTISVCLMICLSLCIYLLLEYFYSVLLVRIFFFFAFAFVLPLVPFVCIPSPAFYFTYMDPNENRKTKYDKNCSKWLSQKFVIYIILYMKQHKMFITIKEFFFDFNIMHNGY